MELKGLHDFQKLESQKLSLSDRKTLSGQVEFFQSPKSNDVIARQHADCVDRILGFRHKFVEEMLMAEAQNFDPDGTHVTWGPQMHGGVQTWVGLNIQTLQTPYSEIQRILSLIKLKPYQHVIDLGAAYGRMGVVIGGLYIKSSFVGYEFVKSRVEEGNRIFQELGLSRCELKTQDLAAKSFKLPTADVYFIYDYGQVEHINHTLGQIKLNAHLRPIKVIARGKFTKQIISSSHPWLEKLYDGRNSEQFTIYSAFLSD